MIRQILVSPAAVGIHFCRFGEISCVLLFPSGAVGDGMNVSFRQAMIRAVRGI
jgi:hypothetical protein